jgi:hypothetical protein
MDFLGGYAHSPGLNNILLIGGPTATPRAGLINWNAGNLQTAQNAGIGYGITWHQNLANVYFDLNLVAVSCDDNYVTRFTGYPIQGPLDFEFHVQTSNSIAGDDWVDRIVIQNAFEIPNGARSCYGANWSQTQRTYTSPTFNMAAGDYQGVRRFRVFLWGNRTFAPEYNIYNVADIMTDYRPLAVRDNGGTWRTLNIDRGVLQVRNGAGA